ncbi:MAG: pseudouridine synthase [Bacteroidota bacterium]
MRKGKSSAASGRGKTSRKISRSSGKDESKPKRSVQSDTIRTKPSPRKEFAPGRAKSYPKPKGKESQPQVADTLAKEGPIRLNRYIANSGVCSRREADNLIRMGVITVNGKVVTELGYKVNPGDNVRYEGKLLTAEKPVYILMNKPKGYLTTTRDPKERDTVMALIGNKVRERIYPVGRLDRNTTGLLLLTNDGELAEKLSHPSHNVKKIYKVELDRPIEAADFDKLVKGVQLEEGRAVPDDAAIVSDDRKTLGIELHIGWNRVVRRIFEALGYEVRKLDRTMYAGLDKRDLPRGKWRHLTKQEVIRLKHYR